MPNGQCCGDDFPPSRTPSVGAGQDAAPPATLQTAAAAPAPELCNTISEFSTSGAQKKQGVQHPRELRSVNVMSRTGLATGALQSQSIDPYLAEAARKRVLAVPPRKPYGQSLQITSANSPYHTKAKMLLAVHRSGPSHTWAETDSQMGKSLRSVKYTQLSQRERSARVEKNYFAYMSNPDFAETGAGAPIPSGSSVANRGYLTPSSSCPGLSQSSDSRLATPASSPWAVSRPASHQLASWP